MSLLQIEEPDAVHATAGRAGPALFALGFRPFYLLGAAFAGLAVPAWLATVFGWLEAPRLNLLWHMHEMLYGFVVAIVVGFLYTAGRNWTGLWTPRGRHLAALAALWLGGRIAMAALAPPVAAALDLLFLPLAAWPLYRVMRRAGDTRNLALVGVLVVLAGANGVFHAAALGWIALSPLQPLYAALVAIVVLETVIGGRVIPAFTAGAVPGSRLVPLRRLEQACLGLSVATGVAWAAWPGSHLLAALALGASATQAARMAGWKPLCTLRQPLLWILHLSYAWIPLGFLMLAASCFGLAPASAAVHLLALGAIGGLVIGMITRTALGHTGRGVQAGRAELAMYVLLQGGVLARLAAALGNGWTRDGGLLLAAACWSLAFGLYCVVYGPYLVRARVDGREG